MIHDAAWSQIVKSKKRRRRSTVFNDRLRRNLCRKQRYDAGVPEICPATEVKVVRALLPTVRTAVKQITMISDNITAYSTAVGPSSDFRKR